MRADAAAGDLLAVIYTDAVHCVKVCLHTVFAQCDGASFGPNPVEIKGEPICAEHACKQWTTETSRSSSLAAAETSSPKRCALQHCAFPVPR